MRLAGVVLQLDWQAALEGSQMMQKPAEFARIAEESVGKNMDRIRLEASSRGWLSKDLPSGTHSVSSQCANASLRMCEKLDLSADVRYYHSAARWQLASPEAKWLWMAMRLRLWMGFAGRNEGIIMAGHSAGGQVAEQYALKNTGGLILLVRCSSQPLWALYISEWADNLFLYCLLQGLRPSVTKTPNV